VSTHGEQIHPDRRTVERARAGDAEAAELLIERLECIPLILHARNLRHGGCFTEDEIVDLTQETLTTVWRKLDTYEGRSSLESWVYSYCIRHMSNAFRSKRRQPRFSDADEHELAVSAENVHHTLDFEHVYRCLAQIDPDQECVIRLKHFEQLTFEEIARRVGSNTNTTKTHYYRGMVRLRELLERDFKESFA